MRAFVHYPFSAASSAAVKPIELRELLNNTLGQLLHEVHLSHL